MFLLQMMGKVYRCTYWNLSPCLACYLSLGMIFLSLANCPFVTFNLSSVLACILLTIVTWLKCLFFAPMHVLAICHRSLLVHYLPLAASPLHLATLHHCFLPCTCHKHQCITLTSPLSLAMWFLHLNTCINVITLCITATFHS